MIKRFSARATRAAIGLCAAALISATPAHADEAWLQRAFERNEARTSSASLSRERRAASMPRARHIQRRPQRVPKSTPAPLLAQLSSVPIVGSILSMVGLHEHRNRGQLRSRIGVDPARTPWCGFLMGWALRQAGRTPPPGHGLARSWTAYGSSVALSSAQAGDVVVTRTRRGSHVAAFHSHRGDRVCLAGGNQSNRVSVACVSAGSVVAVRR